MKHRSVVSPLVVLTLIMMLTLPAVADAWTASGFGKVAINEDGFYNYDCESTTAAFDNVDWPVTFIFYGNATVAKVDTALSSRLPIWGVDEYMALDDGAGWQWVSNTGVKSFSLSRAIHLRLYAPAGTYFTNKNWGKYVIATCHLDINELSSSPTSGYSEDAATEIAQMCRSIWGKKNVAANSFALGNPEPLRTEERTKTNGDIEHHVWQSDGFATLVKVR
jgi:hypothetical protein